MYRAAKTGKRASNRPSRGSSFDRAPKKVGLAKKTLFSSGPIYPVPDLKITPEEKLATPERNPEGPKLEIEVSYFLVIITTR